MPLASRPLRGVGLGLRRALADELLAAPTTDASFVELSPENFLGAGGPRARLLARAAERFPLSFHGLAGDFAGAAPIDEGFVSSLRALLHAHHAPFYSDHLCLTHAAGRPLHDLLPLPHTEEAVTRAATRIRALRDRLELPLAIENVSAYARWPGATMDEPTFVRAVLEEADCALLLDVNNVYVNAVNFGFDARAYVAALPLDRVVELHVAGHDEEAPGLLVDTHGAPIAEPVYALLAFVVSRLPRPVPILLERDFRIPPLAALERELARLTALAGP